MVDVQNHEVVISPMIRKSKLLPLRCFGMTRLIFLTRETIKMNTWMYFLMMMMMMTPLFDLVKTRKGRSVSTSILLADNSLQLCCIRTWTIDSPCMIREGNLEVHVDGEALPGVLDKELPRLMEAQEKRKDELDHIYD